MRGVSNISIASLRTARPAAAACAASRAGASRRGQQLPLAQAVLHHRRPGVHPRLLGVLDGLQPQLLGSSCRRAADAGDRHLARRLLTHNLHPRPAGTRGHQPRRDEQVGVGRGRCNGDRSGAGPAPPPCLLAAARAAPCAGPRHATRSHHHHRKQRRSQHGTHAAPGRPRGGGGGLT